MIRPGLLPIAFLIAITLWLLFLRDPPPDICVAGIGTYLPIITGLRYSQNVASHQTCSDVRTDNAILQILSAGAFKLPYRLTHDVKPQHPDFSLDAFLNLQGNLGGLDHRVAQDTALSLPIATPHPQRRGNAR